jgi:hypothetical protein
VIGMNIAAGSAIEVRTVGDEWLPAIAMSGVEGTYRDGRKIHDFPVIWVTTDPSDVAVPWPAEDVRPRSST